MRTIIYAHRDHADEALALVARLRVEGVTALYRDTRGFSGDIERCDRVVTDDVAVIEAHEAVGIEVVAFQAREPSVPDDVPEPEPMAHGSYEEPDYRVEETSPGWWKLLDPDGEQVGKSVRSEADAWALLDED